jgi:DNA repair exonuclease SbcCD nuclease subunit
MKVLVVGDLHAVPDELADCRAVVGLILDICRSQNITEVWWTGDQHHSHAVIRVEVLHWFKVAFRALKAQGINSVCLVGNHDQASPGSSAHAMMAYQNDPGVTIIDTPRVHRGVLMVPYIHDQQAFLKAVNAFTSEETDERWVPAGETVKIFPKTMFCHQTFDGSCYENGFMASDGFDPNLVPQELIISGHIHTGQEFGKVWYVGAPRWRTSSDANVERSLWVLEFSDEGKLVNRMPFGTGDVCRQIFHLEDTPADPVVLPLDTAHQWRIDIKGPADWCQSRKLQLKAAGAKIRIFPEQISTAGQIRESEGIEKAFQSFLGGYQPKYGTGREILAKMAKDRLRV